MRTLAIFVHYSEKDYIPEYVLTYIKELKKYFNDIILATNNRNITNIFQINKLDSVKCFLFKNEGYDFGLFYKSLHSTDLEIYDRISFINDSNILLKPLTEVFKWGNNQNIDVWGLTDSYENVPNSKHIDSYHIQSHFLVFEKKSISSLLDFFDFIKFEEVFKLNLSKRELWLKIVEDCEIGISQYMLSKGLKIGAMYQCEDFVKSGNYKSINIHMKMWRELLQENYPLIKKKIITKAFDPIYEKNVAKLINADLADKYINKYKDKNNWKIDL